MRYAQKTAILIGTVTLATAVLAPRPGSSQTNTQTTKPISPSRAENNARFFEINAGTITVFDRQGRLVKTVGPRGRHGGRIFSPDGQRLAVITIDPEQENRDLWVFDIDTGDATRITTSERGEGSPFDASKSEAPGPAVQVSKDGMLGSDRRDSDGTVDITWRRDGKELYFVSRKMEVTAVDVTATPALKVGTPKVLFKLAGLIVDGGSLDGQRFVFLMPVKR